MKLHILYKSTNRVNGKVFWGVHETHDIFFGTAESCDSYCGNTTEILADLKTMGRGAFVVESIQAFTDSEQALEHLRRYVANAPANSYHVKKDYTPQRLAAIGNEYARGLVHSEETKKHLSEISKGSSNPNYGNKYSEETRTQMSEFRKSLCWVHNKSTGVEKQIEKDSIIPRGYVLGRAPKRKAPPKKTKAAPILPESAN
jgi:hypothetical protein